MFVKLSVVIPIYNTKRYLSQCIDSVLGQTLKSIEIILVDDQSPDGAGELCDEYAQKYSCIKVIHKKNEGLGFARNSGIDAAKGDYIAFLDSDDFVDKEYYKQLVDFCEEKNAEICYAAGIYNYTNGLVQKVVFQNIQGLDLNTKAGLLKAAPRVISSHPGKQDGISGSSCLSVYRRDFIENNHLRFISERVFISEDIWFNLDCFYFAEKIVYSNVIGYYYRYNNTSLSRKYNPNRFSLLIDSERQLIDRCEALQFVDYYERVAIHFWINYEKCINQEVRFNTLNKSVVNIRNMNENKLSQALIRYLYSTETLDGMHKILCGLLRKNRYHTVIFLLKLYNAVKHK